MATSETKPPPPDSQVFVIPRRSPGTPLIPLIDPSPPPAPSSDNPPPPASPPTAPESPYSEYEPPTEETPPPPPSLFIDTPPSLPRQTPPSNSPPTPIQENVKNPPPTITPINTEAPPTNTNASPTNTEAPPTNTDVPPEVDPKEPPAIFDSKVSPINPDEEFRPPSHPTSGSTVTLAPPVESSRLPKHSPPPPIASDQSPASASSNSNQMVMVVGLSVAGLLILAVLAVCLLFCRKKKKQAYYYGNERQNNDPYYGTREWNSNRHSQGDHIVGIPPQSQGMMMVQSSGNYSNDYTSVNSSGQYPGQTHSPLGSSQCQFSYEDLAAATGGFTQANLLGQGGFGYVHKGVLPDGKVVAVKSLKSGSGQGEREFQAEVEIISRVHHRHLVSLVGYCITNESRMLVYEFVPNQTMEHHLHGKGQPVMDWSFRVRVAIGSAKGLAYLHEDCHPRIIHRDIKAANILLDENYEAMVADFGLAKLTTDTDTHVSTRVMGTFGYLAPEYASSGKLSEKSDVFSFGVMLLELITGRRPVDLTGETMEDSLADWARPLLEQAMEDGNIDELVDPRLEGNFSPEEMNSMISCAAASIRHSARRRPKMSQIVRALEGNSILVEETSQVPKKTGSIASGTSSHDTTYDTVAYNADMMKFRNMVMSSKEFGTTSEFGDTSEYGLNPSISSSSNNSKEMGALNSGQHKIKY